MKPRNHQSIRFRVTAVGAAALLGIAADAARAQNAPPPPPDGGRQREGPPRGERPQRPQAEKIAGTVTGYNFGPRGEVQGLMIKTGDKTVQVNLPPDLGAMVSQQAAVGSQAEMTGVLEPGRADHPVYGFRSITSGGHELKVPSPEDEKFVHLEGSIKQLNYGRRGEINGVVLESGDLVEFGPAAKELNLQPGRKIAVDGAAHPMLTGGHQVVRAEALDGKPLHEGHGGPGAGTEHEGHGPDAGPEGDGPPRPDGPRARGGPQGRRGPGGPEAEDRPRPPQDGPDRPQGGRPPAPGQ